jgi:hypothetical protein
MVEAVKFLLYKCSGVKCLIIGASLKQHTEYYMSVLQEEQKSKLVVTTNKAGDATARLTQST